jgi:hypothetical protein
MNALERASLSYSVSEPLPGRASTAVVRTITPTPPIHSINERHHCSVAGSTASLSVIVSPVPVNPLIDSKKPLSGFSKAASVGVGAGVLRPKPGSSATVRATSVNGSDPNSAMQNHPEAAIVIP